jgi:hypothetical protein
VSLESELEQILKNFVLQVIWAMGICGIGTGVCACIHAIYRLAGGDNAEQVKKDLKFFLMLLWGQGFTFFLLYSVLSNLFG